MGKKKKARRKRKKGIHVSSSRHFRISRSGEIQDLFLKEVWPSIYYRSGQRSDQIDA